jgi:5-methylcytosine-specific restriction endonuclease McrA
MMEKRQCFSPPISEIFEAADLLKRGVSAHIQGDFVAAEHYFRAADIPAIGDWLDPIWLRKSDLVRREKVTNVPPIVPKEKRYKPRIAPRSLCKALVTRDGHHCRFCGMPLVRSAIRKCINKLYPSAARWTSPKETDQHRGLQVMWMQFDHLLVHSRGGATDLENLVVACAACNFGRDRFTLDEMRLTDPRIDVRLPSWEGRHTWDGLEILLPEPLRYVQAPDSVFRPIGVFTGQ